MKQRNAIQRICIGGAVAALYTVLTVLLAPISFGVMQLRVAEGMTILPVIMPETIPGLVIGCIISNAIGVAMGTNIAGALDILLGSLATLLAAVCAYLLRKVRFFGVPLLSALMAPIFNGLIVGGELAYVLKLPFFATALSVGVEELIVSVVLGLPLYVLLNRTLFREKTAETNENGEK